MIIFGEKTSNAYEHNIIEKLNNTWTQNIVTIFQSRNIYLINYHSEKLISNKTLMNYIIIYINIKKLPIKIISIINQIRI